MFTVSDTRMFGNNSARDARAAQRGEFREQSQQDEVEVMKNPDLITAQNVQGQEAPSSPTVGGQLKVMVHSPEEVEELPAEAYTAAVARLIAVSNTEVKRMARKIAQARRKMDGAVEGMWDAIKSADKSTNPAIKERIAEIRERMAKVKLTSDLLHQAIEETVDTVNAHLVDEEQTDMESTLMKMLMQTAQHTRKARQEGHKCQDRLEKFEKSNSTPTTPAQPARSSGSSSGSWGSMWKADQSLNPAQLNKDAVPCDFRNFQRDFATYIRSGETATVKATAIQTVGQLRVCIDSELRTHEGHVD